MISADDVAWCVMPFDYLVAHGVDGGDLEDDYWGAARVTVDPDTGAETPYTGFVHEIFASQFTADYYDVCVEGIGSGPSAEVYANGRVKELRTEMNGCGAAWSFFESGALQRVSFQFAGDAVAYREFDEDGNLLAEKTDLAPETWQVALRFAGI